MKHIVYYTLLFVSLAAQSQDSVKTNLIAGGTYHSALNYYGRTDELKSKGFIPFVGINFKSGLYLNATFVFVSNKNGSEYAATIGEAGYNFENANKTWVGNVFIRKNFYNERSTLVQSALKGSAGINISNLNNIININIGGDVKLSEKIDFGSSVGIDHLLRFSNVLTGNLFFDPSVYAYAGSQNFSKSYLEKRNFLLFPAEETVTENVSRFSVLAYEISCPMILAVGKMRFVVTPAYIVPENIIDGESAENMFYMTGTVRVQF